MKVIQDGYHKIIHIHERTTNSQLSHFIVQGTFFYTQMSCCWKTSQIKGWISTFDFTVIYFI